MKPVNPFSAFLSPNMNQVAQHTQSVFKPVAQRANETTASLNNKLVDRIAQKFFSMQTTSFQTITMGFYDNQITDDQKDPKQEKFTTRKIEQVIGKNKNVIENIKESLREMRIFIDRSTTREKLTAFYERQENFKPVEFINLEQAPGKSSRSTVVKWKKATSNHKD
jgi:hypothetical protein